jgi:clan AA aspartic protease (TIGR02281 family)
MVKTTLTTAAMLAVLTGAAQADRQMSLPLYLICQPAQDLLATNDPSQAKVRGALVAIDNNGWHVDYMLANEQIVHRNDQYIFYDTGNMSTWAGTHRTRNNLRMLGEVHYDGQDISHFYYHESLFDYGQPGKPIVLHTQADCRRVTDLASMTPYASGPYTAPRPAPTSPPPGATQPAHDSVPLYFDGSQAWVDVQVGSQSVRMLVDTGAAMMALPASFANRLLAAGEAEYGPQMQVTLANGSVINVRVINIRTVTIGGHVLHNVLAGVSPEGAEALLSFSILNMIGRFTIDTQSHQLIFG